MYRQHGAHPGGPAQQGRPRGAALGGKAHHGAGWYEADGWEAGCERCIELINYGGRGHSLVIHAQDENVVMRFGLEKPVFRILVNTMGTLGATGMTTGVMPSMTLGPGGIGGAITGDNITVQHLYNVKRLAYELNPPPAAALLPGSTDDPAQLRRAAVRQASAAAPSRSIDPGHCRGRPHRRHRAACAGGVEE